MMKKSVLNPLSWVLVVLLMGSGVSGASKKIDGEIEFLPVDLLDDGGAKLSKGLLTYNGLVYEVDFNGLGVGGNLDKQVKVSGEVYGLARVEDVEGVYVTELEQDKSKASKKTLWLDNPRGVRIYLKINNPELSLASGSNRVTVQFSPR